MGAGWITSICQGGGTEPAKQGCPSVFGRPLVKKALSFTDSPFLTSFTSSVYVLLESRKRSGRENAVLSTIGYVTPQDRHTGRDKAILAKRRKVYEKARQRNPERWSGHTRNWNRVEVVRLNPDAETKHADEAHATAA